ncbi:hypothetical protein FOTG_08246 [Fusarium oxysporum f. sp. vasinfectum 25433]|uniref:Uncharacterized protein n=1 Tax=Fusarium oxysporum f. sp. vasinfectum 25433 TaxID=1089449 RepID=X0LU73_FUSOX|nr:hypothetical protein FOTG_08246 [Fusarium oxysporum f. sp. vasinfectum 25433]
MYERKVHASVPIRGSPLSVRRVSGSDSAASALTFWYARTLHRCRKAVATGVNYLYMPLELRRRLRNLKMSSYKDRI